MYNKIIIVGNITRDIELRKTEHGFSVAQTAIATNRKYKSRSDELIDEVCFVDITLWGKTAEVAEKYLSKGSKILIDGRLKFDRWTDKNGSIRTKHSITVESMKMLDSKNETGSNTQHSEPKERADNAASGENNKFENNDLTQDEIPF